MHSAPMPDSAGKFNDWERANGLCRKCQKRSVRYRVWESSCGGFEDLKFECENCGETWWVEGSDA